MSVDAAAARPVTGELSRADWFVIRKSVRHERANREYLARRRGLAVPWGAIQQLRRIEELAHQAALETGLPIEP